jgi:hypothetical protein
MVGLAILYPWSLHCLCKKGDGVVIKPMEARKSAMRNRQKQPMTSERAGRSAGGHPLALTRAPAD